MFDRIPKNTTRDNLEGLYIEIFRTTGIEASISFLTLVFFGFFAFQFEEPTRKS